MAKCNSSSASSAIAKWNSDTTSFFQYRCYEIESILSVLIVNIGEYRIGDGRASDEAIFLAIQNTRSTIAEIEKLSRELDVGDGAGVGDISLNLMWARALLEILEGMAQSENCKICISDDSLSSYLAKVERLVKRVNEEVEKVHAFYFQKAA